MYTFEFFVNAYWTIDENINACYIRTIGNENVDAILQKYDHMPGDPRWNKDTVLINDYVDIGDAVLSAHDVLRISELHERTTDRLGFGKWYFIVTRKIHYGIIRMYSLYVNSSFEEPQIIVCKKIEEIPDERIRKFADECRYDSRIFEKLTKD